MELDDEELELLEELSSHVGSASVVMVPGVIQVNDGPPMAAGLGLVLSVMRQRSIGVPVAAPPIAHCAEMASA